MTDAPVAIGDVHGRLDLLELVVARFPGRHLVFLGDLCDRGPESRGVIALVRELVGTGCATLLLGNHDQMFSLSHAESQVHHFWDHWMHNGGQSTLDSYGPDHVVRQEDALWIQTNALPWLVRGEVLFSHAMRPDPSGHDIDAHLWGRPSDTPLYPLPSGVTHSVHGHTPMERPISVLAPDGTVAWFIDTGACRTGVLCALDTADWTPHLIEVTP